MTKYFSEETYFSVLTKLLPLLAVIIRVFMVGEHVSSTVPVLYSCCTKSPFQWRDIVDLVTLPTVSVMVFIMTFIGLGMQVAIFVKLKRLETQPHNDNKWAVSFSARKGVNLEQIQGDPSGQLQLPVDLDMGHSAILPGQKVARVAANKPPDLSELIQQEVVTKVVTNQMGHPVQQTLPCCKVWRHRRNVVSPEGSCASFIICQMWFLGVSYHIFNLSDLGSPTVLDFLLFVTPSVDFFVLNLIETLCSPTLRKSLISCLLKL